MKREKFKKLLEDKVLFLDGAYGTEFIKKGYKEDLFEILNIKDPDIVKELHKKYVDSASDILITNTFSANRYKLNSYGLKDEFVIINENAVKIARSAGNINTIIFGDIGPIGSQIEPFGNITFLQAFAIFKEQAEILIKTGVDGIILETFSDIKELKAAILAIKEVDDDIPIIANMTFTENGISITGSSVENFATIINDLDIDVAGINCTLGSEQILSIFNQFSLFCKKPLCIEPNAGIPQYIDGNLNYNIDPVKFAIYSKNLVEIGANIIGGCCGTGPDHIKTMVEFVGNKKPKKREIPERQYLSSRTILNNVEPFLIIGEKINASAKKSLQAKIENNYFELIINLAQKQEKQEALCIDINPGNENQISKENIRNLINELDKYSSLPLSLDIQNPDFLETALQEYPGRALINSTTCEKEKLKRILKLLKKYGGMLVVLAMENEVPETYLQRIRVIKEAIKQIKECEIDLNRIYFDPLILPFASNNDYHVPLKIIEYLNKIGLKSIIGLSNLSFAMPEREKINSVFLCLAIEEGLNAAILDTSSNITMDILKGSLILSGKEVMKIEKEDEDPIIKIILNGDKENLLNIIKEKLKELSPLNISNEFLFNVMKKIGDLYSDGKIFLPHLLRASETAQVAFDYLNILMQNNNTLNRGKILLATVEGDIHDIGKKIVATVLKSYGFEIVDAGKNVNKEFLLKQIMSEKPDIIGLSAMMTTTVNEIKNIAEFMKEKEINIPIIAGGASMNQKIADQFKVFYAKDPFEAIKIIDEIKKQK